MRPDDPADNAADNAADSDSTVLADADGAIAVLPRNAPERIGPYRLLELLGVGGMGEVYLAEQREPVERRLAIKLIRRETEQGISSALFEVERQMLARMQHPYVAQVFDAGATQDGRPWLAMEWVRGEPIIDFAHRHRLDREARVALLIRVCQGVQHAHQRGVIHRDLKPANILVADVDGRPLPKIIDFGIATTLIGDSATGLRASGSERAGTRAYMSPEQLGGDPAALDTRADVYALGILLFELLSETRPLVEVSARGLATLYELLQAAGGTSRETARGSALLSPEAIQAVCGLSLELRWIIARAIAPDRNRRYPSASALAADLQRFLDNELVEAVPPARAYRWRKFISRHRFGVSATTLVGLALVAGLTLAVWGLGQAQAERDRARQQAERAQRAAEFVQNMLKFVNPVWAQGLDNRLFQQVLEDAAGRLASELADQPQIRADIELTIALAYRGIGEYQRASGHIDSVLALSAAHRLPALEAQTLAHAAHLATLMDRQEEGLALSERALALGANVLPADDPILLAARVTRAYALVQLRRFDEAEPILIDVIERTDGSSHPEARAERLQALRILGQLYSDQVLYEPAARYFGQLLDEASAWDDPRAQESLMSGINDFAVVYLRQQRYAEAEPLLRRSLALKDAVFPEDHIAMVPALGNLAAALRAQGQAEAALPYYQRSHAIASARLGPEHMQTLMAASNLGNGLRETGAVDEALALQRAVVERAWTIVPDNEFLIGMFHLGLGQSELAAGNLPAAHRALSLAVSLIERTMGADFGRAREAREYLALTEARGGASDR